MREKNDHTVVKLKSLHSQICAVDGTRAMRGESVTTRAAIVEDG